MLFCFIFLFQTENSNYGKHNSISANAIAVHDRMGYLPSLINIKNMHFYSAQDLTPWQELYKSCS